MLSRRREADRREIPVVRPIAAHAAPAVRAACLAVSSSSRARVAEDHETFVAARFGFCVREVRCLTLGGVAAGLWHAGGEHGLLK